MLQDIEKMKVQYLMSLSFDLFEILQAVRSKQISYQDFTLYFDCTIIVTSQIVNVILFLETM